MDVVLVASGGVVGAAARELVEQALPTAARTIPVATLVVNLTGAFVLGLLLEALARAGDDSGRRRRLRLLVGTGMLGAFTTYSTLAVETDLLVRADCPGRAVAYAAASLVGGLVASFLGMVVAGGRGPAPAPLPVDPDPEVER